MAIGRSMDIYKMLQKAVEQYIKKLECSAGLVYRIEPGVKDKKKINPFFSLPYTLAIKDDFEDMDKLFSREFTEKQYDNFVKKLKWNGKTASGVFFHIIELYRFGFLVLFKEKDPIESSTLDALTEVNRKLGSACSACMKNEALSESETRYRRFIEWLPEMICEVNMEGYILYANSYALEKMGYKSLDIVRGFHISKLVAERDRKRLLANFKKSITRTETSPREYAVVTRKGRELSVLIYTSIIYEYNKPVGIRGVMVDISDRKANELKLQQNAQRLELALLGSDAGLWDWNLLKGEIFVSERWCNMLGYKQSELSPSVDTWKEMMHEEDLDEVSRALNDHFEGKTELYRSRHRFRTKDGDWRWVLDTGKVTERDENGKPLRVVGTHVDITATWQTERLTTIEQELNIKLSKIKDLKTTLELCLMAAVEYTCATAGGLYLLSDHDNIFRLGAGQGYDAEVERDLYNFVNSPDIASRLLKGEPVFDLCSNAGSALAKKSVKGCGFIPVKHANRVIGCMVLASSTEHQVAEFTFQVIEKVVAISGTYIIRAKEEERQALMRQDLDTLFNTIDDFLFVMDREGGIKHVNSVVYNKLGYSRDDLQNRNIIMLHQSESQSDLQRLFGAVKEERENIIIAPLLTKDSSEIPCETKLILGKWENSEAVIAICRDITEREKANEKLREQSTALAHGFKQQSLLSDIALELNTLGDFDRQLENILREIGEHTGVSRVYIFEDSKDGAFTSNTFEWCNENVVSVKAGQQDLAYANLPSLKKLLQENGSLHSEDINGLPPDLAGFLRPQDIKSLIVYPLYVKEKPFGFIGFDECVRRKKWARGELELLRTISGNISNAYERRLMERSIINERDRANQANSAKSEFLANMSHEIRTPMNAILGFSESLYHKLDSKQHKNMLRSVLSSGNLLHSLINDILDLSKIEAGKMEISLQSVDLINLISEIEMLFKEKAMKKGIDFIVEIEEDFPGAVKLDELRIKQVIFNIAGNAIKFTHKGYVKIKLSFEEQSEEKGILRMEIEDTGIGIPEDQQQRVFEAFTQQEGQLNRLYGGTGLGLTISDRLVRKMGGRIELKSRQGEGSVFSLILPDTEVTKLRPKNKHFVDESLESIDFGKQLIMVVDDVLPNIKVVEKYVANAGLSMVSAETGDIALEILNNTKPALILLDLRIPGLDGFQVAERIKSREDLKDIPVIAYTASVFSSEKIDECGFFDGNLFKPVNKYELLNTLKDFLPHKIREQEVESSAMEVQEEKEPEIPDDIRERLPEIIEDLEGGLMDTWKEIKDSLVLFKIESFVKELKAVAENYGLDMFVDYAMEMQGDIDMLELEGLKYKLRAYKEKVEYLKAVEQKV